MIRSGSLPSARQCSDLGGVLVGVAVTRGMTAAFACLHLDVRFRRNGRSRLPFSVRVARRIPAAFAAWQTPTEALGLLAIAI
jgi:hypothetical protein